RERSVLMRRLIPRVSHVHLLVAAALSFALVLPASAVVLHYRCVLNGANESPPNANPGVGNVEVTIDNTANSMRVAAVFSGLLGTTTACHIHAPTAVPLTGTAGVATMTPFFTGFPTGVTNGSFDTVFDLTLTSTYNSTYV